MTMHIQVKMCGPTVGDVYIKWKFLAWDVKQPRTLLVTMTVKQLCCWNCSSIIPCATEFTDVSTVRIWYVLTLVDFIYGYRIVMYSVCIMENLHGAKDWTILLRHAGKPVSAKLIIFIYYVRWTFLALWTLIENITCDKIHCIATWKCFFGTCMCNIRRYQ